MLDEAIFLLVEDSDDDILLTRRSFRRAEIRNPLQVVHSVDEAICYLGGEGLFSNRLEFPLPALVLLDLKMPRREGFELIEWVRSQPSFLALRIIVLTSSDSRSDVERAYDLGANSYLVKPVESEAFVEALRMLKQYWIGYDKAPSVRRPPRAHGGSSELGRN
jgi:CheY-like chemotaxis protein